MESGVKLLTTGSSPGDPSGLRMREGCLPEKNTNSVLERRNGYSMDKTLVHEIFTCSFLLTRFHP